MKKLLLITLLLFAFSCVHLTYGQDRASFNGIYQTSVNGVEFKLYDDSTKSFKADKKPIVSFSDFKKVKIKKSPHDRTSMLFIKLNKTGKEKFSKATKQNIRKHLLIIFKGKLLSAPVVIESITGGEIQVSGIEKSICKEIVKAYKKR